MFKTSILATTCAVLFLSTAIFVAQANAASTAPVAVATQTATTTAAVQPVSTNGTATFMQACSTQWKAAKAAGTVPAGQKWTDYLKTCSASAASAPPAPLAPAKAVATAPAAKPVATAPVVVAAAPAVKKPIILAPKATAATAPSGAIASEQARIKECGAEWKIAKASKTVPAGQTWPQYWSACDARLKG